MTYASALAAVQRALATGQIGTPVAVRSILHTANQPDQVQDLAALALDRALVWLDEAPNSLFASGGTDDGQITLLVKTASGRSALISTGTQRGAAACTETIVFGSRGMMSWEGDCGVELSPQHDAELSPIGERAAGMLRASLEQGAPVNANGQFEVRRPRSDNSPTRDTDSVKPKPLDPPYGLLLVAGDHTHQPGYAEALIADGRCKLIGLADEDDVSAARRKLNERLAKRLQIPVLPSLSEALKRNDVHIVSVCAEPSRRGRIIVAAAEAGKHLYLDKPLAGSLSDADAIVSAVRKANVVAHMFSQVHGEPAQRARAVVESGQLGELVAVHCDACFAKGHGGTADLTKPRRESEVPKRFELADSKRELSNVGVYPVAMLSWLLGRDMEQVYGVTGNFFFAEHQGNDMEDFGQMMIQFEGDITATVSAGRAGWRSHPGFGIHRVCLVGMKATATVDVHRPRVEVWADVPPWTAPPRDPEDPMGMWAAPPDSPYEARPKESWILPARSGTSDAEHFLDCVQHGRQSEMPVDIAAKSTEALLAAYQSAASGSLIELPLPR
jgi:predicted dehydrogenase